MNFRAYRPCCQRKRAWVAPRAGFDLCRRAKFVVVAWNRTVIHWSCIPLPYHCTDYGIKARAEVSTVQYLNSSSYTKFYQLTKSFQIIVMLTEENVITHKTPQHL